SVIKSRTVARSPALLADIQVASNVRIACSSSLIARIEQNDCKSATGHSRPKRSKPHDRVCPRYDLCNTAVRWRRHPSAGKLLSSGLQSVAEFDCDLQAV